MTTKKMPTYFIKELNKLSQLSGIYKFIDNNGTTLYIGKAINLKKRVASYFQKKPLDKKTENLIKQITRIDTIEVQSEFEALLLEAKLINTVKPKYNVIWKDDKHYIYIKITKEEFPRILFARKPEQKDGIYFGPFPSKLIVTDLLHYLRPIFPYCTQPRHVKKACFYTHIGLCNPCPANIKKLSGEEYREARNLYLKNIRQIKSLLSGSINPVRKYLIKQMENASKSNDFELAANYRDKIETLEYLIHNYHPAQEYIDNPQLSVLLWNKERDELRDLLAPYFALTNSVEKIECYDISNISGKLGAGSMVTFRKGLPDKNYYRRFQIRSKNKPDDFAMLSEIMRRRLNHPEWELPDVFVIDGGKPQLIALMKVLKNYKINIPLIGLAKEQEEIVIPHQNTFIKLKLPSRSSALALVLRLRDEAHRFAHKYHEYLRAKYFMSA